MNSALWDAPLVFIAILALAILAAYWFASMRYEGVVDALRAQVSSLQDQVTGLRDQLQRQGQPSLSTPEVYEETMEWARRRAKELGLP